MSPGNDDYAAMEEVLTRRFTALLEARAETRGQDATAGSARARRFAYPPQLLLLDGGKGQLGVGVRVLRDWVCPTRSQSPLWQRASRRCSCREAPTR